MANTKNSKKTEDNTANNTDNEEPKFIVGFSFERSSNSDKVTENSIFYEKDTGKRYRFLANGSWEYIDNIHE